MHLKNVATGEIETMRHGPATDAITAGTHEAVNLDEKGISKDGSGAASNDPALKPVETVTTPVPVVAVIDAGSAAVQGADAQGAARAQAKPVRS